MYLTFDYNSVKKPLNVSITRVKTVFNENEPANPPEYTVYEAQSLQELELLGLA